MEEARQMGLALPLTGEVWARLNMLQAWGGANQDTASLFRLYDEVINLPQ